MTFSSNLERSVGDVAESLRNAKERGNPCSVLIGAGCSLSAGIPLAQGFVEEVKRRYPHAYARAKTKTYPAVMAELGDGPLYHLVATIIERARINWGHLQLAWLMANGYVGRVLTTNFDNLIQRACAFFGLYPAVYDLAAAPRFSPSLVNDPAVFYLHGQFRGFIQLHRENEVKRNARRLRPAFEDATVRRPWIVVGYSGDNDPVFENLAAIPKFVFNLFWVSHQKKDPSVAVASRLLTPGRQAYLVRAQDSDQYLIELCRALGMEAPPFVTDPFTHELSMIESLASFPADDLRPATDILQSARKWLTEARARFVEPRIDPEAKRDESQLEALVMKHLIEGNYQAVVSLIPNEDSLRNRELEQAFDWAFIRQASSMYGKSGGRDKGTPIDDLFFDMASLQAARGDLTQCLEWLQRRMAVAPPLDPARIQSDPHFAQVAHEPSFRKFMNALESRVPFAQISPGPKSGVPKNASRPSAGPARAAGRRTQSVRR